MKTHNSAEFVTRTTMLRTLLLAAGLCALLSIPKAWITRAELSGDGQSYLEIAYNTVHGGPWYLVSNGFWSPAYPALLSVALKIFRPSLSSELATVHWLAYLICVGTYLTFTFFFLSLLEWVEITQGPVLQSRARFPAIVLFAYSLVFVSNVGDQLLWMGHPDMMVEGLIFLAAGMCIRLSMPHNGPRFVYHGLLGLVLALAYATKASLFPLSGILLAILLVRPLSRYRGRMGVIVATVVFLLAASPLVAVLSRQEGRLTFGDSAARLNYAFRVNEIPLDSARWKNRQEYTDDNGLYGVPGLTLHAMLWKNSLPGAGAALHPAKIISRIPPILKFDGPFQATDPVWYDPSYWWDGLLQVHFDPSRLAVRLLRFSGFVPTVPEEGLTLGDLVARVIPMLAGMAAFMALGLRPRKTFEVMRQNVWLFLWPLCALFIFASVLLLFRYIVAFWVLGWTALFVAACVAMEPQISRAVTLTVAAGLLFTYSLTLGETARLLRRHPDGGVTMANKLKALGLRPGDEIASVGFASLTYPVRLIGARFTLEIIPDGDWSNEVAVLSRLPEADVARIITMLRENGARFLFSPGHPAFANDAGWSRVGDTWIRML